MTGTDTTPTNRPIATTVKFCLMKLIADKTEHKELGKQLYLAALSRFPSDQELAASREFLADYTTPQECYEDLLWALMNSKQFLFVQ